MKILLFFPKFYSLQSLFKNAFREAGNEVISTDFREFIPTWKATLKKYTNGLTPFISGIYAKHYEKYINAGYLNYAKLHKPDLIILYNNGNLKPDTLNEIKRICPVFNYLGDYPLFLQSKYSLQTTMNCNHVFAPDSYWLDKIENMGHKNTSYLITGYDDKSNFKIEPTTEQLREYGSDLVFIGRGYKRSSYGYKRALFLSKFTNLNLKIYGREWNYWFKLFPNLKSHYIPLDNYLSFEEVNLINNCSKIYPIDLNPGLINGLHIRIFDCIGSGVLPIVEFSKDINLVFQDAKIPHFQNFDEGYEIAQYYLNNEILRIDLLKNLKSFIDKNYSPKIAIEKILSKL